MLVQLTILQPQWHTINILKEFKFKYEDDNIPVTRHAIIKPLTHLIWLRKKKVYSLETKPRRKKKKNNKQTCQIDNKVLIMILSKRTKEYDLRWDENIKNRKIHTFTNEWNTPSFWCVIEDEFVIETNDDDDDDDDFIIIPPSSKHNYFLYYNFFFFFLLLILYALMWHLIIIITQHYSQLYTYIYIYMREIKEILEKFNLRFYNLCS